MFLLGLLLLVPIYYALRYLWVWIEGNELILLENLSNRAVFVTGCDSGFGNLLALKLAQYGMPTYAGCLTKQGQYELVEEAKKRGINDKLLKAVPLDITNDKSVKEAVDFVQNDLHSGDNELWALVNNAGIFSCFGPDAWTTIEDYKLSMEVNCWGTIRHFCRYSSVAKAGLCLSPVLPDGYRYQAERHTQWLNMGWRRTWMRSGWSWAVGESDAAFWSQIDCGAMAARVDKAWQNLTPEMREEYGEQHKCKFVATWNKLFQELASDRLDQVVDAYFHAVTARFPRCRYRVGWDAIWLYIPYSFFPTGLADFAFQTLTKQLIGEQILPAVLEKQKNLHKNKAV